MTPRIEDIPDVQMQAKIRKVFEAMVTGDMG